MGFHVTHGRANDPSVEEIKTMSGWSERQTTSKEPASSRRLPAIVKKEATKVAYVCSEALSTEYDRQVLGFSG